MDVKENRLCLTGIRHAYPGASMPVLKGVDLECAAGEIVGLLGPNGAGKTTLLRIAAGLIRPTEGHVLAAGLDPATTGRRAMASRVVFVPQSLTPDFPITVREFVALGRTPHLRGLFESARDRTAIANALAFTETAALADRLFRELSSGEQKRVLLARSVAQEPALLLLDEPTANLDVGHGLSLLHRLKDLARVRDTAIVAAIHDLNLALLVCDRVLLIHDGRRVADGPPAEVMRPELLASVFGCAFLVGVNACNGRPYLVPMEPE